MESLLGRNDNKKYEKEQKRHKIGVAIIVSVCTVTAVSIFAYIFNSIVNRNYTSYEVLLSNERKDSNSVKYQQYEKGILKYSRDDAKVRDGGVSWNYYIICPVCKSEISKNLFQKSCRIVDFGKPHQLEGPL